MSTNIKVEIVSQVSNQASVSVNKQAGNTPVRRRAINTIYNFICGTVFVM